jgi:hypothetical protein
MKHFEDLDFEYTPPKKEPRQERAERFLIDYLALGPRSSVSVLADAKVAGISRSALSEARQLLPISVDKMPDGCWRWRLTDVPLCDEGAE